MEDKILIAIISASSALIGSFIPTIFNYLNSQEQRDFELKKELFNKQKDLYVELMLVLQDMVNRRGPDEFLKLQEAAIKISTYGDYKPSQVFNEYYNKVVRSTSTPGLVPQLTQQEHKEYQIKILNAMRQSMNLEPLNDFELVSFRPRPTSE